MTVAWESLAAAVHRLPGSVTYQHRHSLKPRCLRPSSGLQTRERPGPAWPPPRRGGRGVLEPARTSRPVQRRAAKRRACLMGNVPHGTPTADCVQGRCCPAAHRAVHQQPLAVQPVRVCCSADVDDWMADVSFPENCCEVSVMSVAMMLLTAARLSTGVAVNDVLWCAAFGPGGPVGFDAGAAREGQAGQGARHRAARHRLGDDRAAPAVHPLFLAGQARCEKVCPVYSTGAPRMSIRECLFKFEMARPHAAMLNSAKGVALPQGRMLRAAKCAADRIFCSAPAGRSLHHARPAVTVHSGIAMN